MSSISNFMAKETETKKEKRCKDCKSTNIHKILTSQYCNKEGKLVKETKTPICYSCYIDLLGGQDI